MEASNFDIVDITDYEIILKIIWDKPEEISKNGTKDVLLLSFNNDSFEKLVFNYEDADVQVFLP